MASGDGWFIEVRGTGEWLRFRDEAYLESSQNKPIPMAQRSSGDWLEQRGRELVATELAAFVSWVTMSSWRAGPCPVY